MYVPSTKSELVVIINLLALFGKIAAQKSPSHFKHFTNIFSKEYGDMLVGGKKTLTMDPSKKIPVFGLGSTHTLSAPGPLG